MTDIKLKKAVFLLREETGMGVADCKKAILYCEEHSGCSPIGYLKAKSLAVATPNLTFLERVREFSKYN